MVQAKKETKEKKEQKGSVKKDTKIVKQNKPKTIMQENKKTTTKEIVKNRTKKAKVEGIKVLSAVLITLLITVLLTWIFKSTTASGETVTATRTQVGLFDLINYPVVAMSVFSNVLIYILSIGGFYAVLYKTGAYRKLLDKIVKKFKGKETIFFVVVMSLLAIFTSVCGASIGLLMILPFIISLVLLMGYNKIVATLTTVGSIAVGLIGTTLSSTYVVSGYDLAAQNGSGIVNTILKTTAFQQITIKVVILVLGLAILIFNTVKYANKNRTKAIDMSSGFIPEVIETKRKSWPIVLIIDLLIIVMLLSLTSWSSVFKINWFTNATTAVKEFSIAKFPIFSKLFGNIMPFEQWSTIDFALLLIVSSFIIAIIYKMGLKKYIKNFVEGAKRAIKPTVIVVLIYTVLVIVSYHPVVLTFIKPLIQKFNVFTMSLAGIISSFFNVDLYYAASSILPYAITNITDTSIYSLISVIWQAMYGFITLVAPTSVILMVTLSYLHISYKEWLKSTWKLLLQLLMLLMIILTIGGIFIK